MTASVRAAMPLCDGAVVLSRASGARRESTTAHAPVVAPV